MITVRCKECGVELTSHPIRTKCCGCSNMTTIRAETISAIDLSKIVMVSNNKETKKSSIFSSEELAYQESRRTRKVRKMDFDIR
jgi:hypothetical protein